MPIVISILLDVTSFVRTIISSHLWYLTINLVDLQKIYLEASYEMEYPTPLLAHFPYGQDLMTSYLTRPTEPLNIGRPIFQPQFFRGFLGDKTDQHFLEENLSVIRTLNSLSLDAGQIGPKHSAFVILYWFLLY
jgi:hypothetical protein